MSYDNEFQIQNLYWRKAKNHEWICPNFYPLGWFECDLFSLTRAGYFHEHEIKLSLQDFRNDAKKFMKIFPSTQIRTKYELLEEGYISGPVHFWYLVPEGLLSENDVPSFAGLKYIVKYGKIEIVKKAPRLHKEKIRPEFYQRIGTTFYYRFWNERTKKR
jgi:hypothetical protein